MVYESAFRDQQLGEIVSRVESVLLDVDSGEVLRHPRSYTRLLKGPGGL